MQLTRLEIVLTAAIALCATSCVSSRSATKSSEFRVESLESVERVDSVIVESSDTVREVTTITIDRNDKGDTLRISTVTDRERVRDRSQLKVKSEELKVKADTVYVEKDSLRLTAYSLPDVTQNRRPSERRAELVRAMLSEKEVDEVKSRKSQKLKPSGFVSALRWVFWILLAIITLIILIRIKLRR